MASLLYMHSGRWHSLPISSFFFMPIFKSYLPWSLWTDWLQISCEAFWWGSLLKLWKLCWLSIFCLFCNGLILSAQFSNFLKILCRLTSNFMRYPGEGFYPSYGNYTDAAILSAEHQGLWASCVRLSLCENGPNIIFNSTFFIQSSTLLNFYPLVKKCVCSSWVMLAPIYFIEHLICFVLFRFCDMSTMYTMPNMYTHLYGLL